MSTLFKYPRTHHIEGSRLQPGDEDSDCVPFRVLEGRYVVVEEKLDGANSGISFDFDGRLLLQSRGHFLDGGPREKHFDLLKTWANSHRKALWDVLGTRYVMYGEWLYAKHTIFYDALPHYFVEFDILEKERRRFLCTEDRRRLLKGLPIVSATVLWAGYPRVQKDLTSLMGPALFKSSVWQETLSTVCSSKRFDPDRIRHETDSSPLMEGLYIKLEEDGIVAERYKYIRPSFLSAVVDSGSHWLDRPIVPNQLSNGVDLFKPTQ